MQLAWQAAIVVALKVGAWQAAGAGAGAALARPVKMARKRTERVVVVVKCMLKFLLGEGEVVFCRYVVM